MQKVISYKTIKAISVFVILFAALSFQSDTSCDTRSLKEKAKKMLDPYTYDMAKLTHINYKVNEWLKETEVPLFVGEKYRLVFNTEGLPKPIIVSVYNRDKDSKKRKLLFTNKDMIDKKQFLFEISGAHKAFVDYEIPAADSAVNIGCMVFMMGYK